MDDIDYESLDVGIRETVRWVRTLGLNTCDSGDGVSKLDSMDGVLTVPHVAAISTRSEMYYHCGILWSALEKLGLQELAQVQGTYSPSDEQCVITLIGVSDASLAVAGKRNLPRRT